MRIIIDTEMERIIVPDSFFTQIDKMNKILSENGTEKDKLIKYEEYIQNEFSKAYAQAPIRKSDLKQYK